MSQLKAKPFESIGWCLTHHKRLYATKKTAKKAAKNHHQDRHMNVYLCDALEGAGLFHIGGLSYYVKSGEVTREEHYGRGS